MNKLIMKQLEKLTIPNKPKFDESTTHLVFPKTGHTEEGNNTLFQTNGVYKIVLANYIVNPPPNFTLDINWNKGKKIQDTNLFIQVNQIAGKMIRFTGRGYIPAEDKTNDNFYDNMWIPAKSIISYERVE